MKTKKATILNKDYKYSSQLSNAPSTVPLRPLGAEIQPRVEKGRFWGGNIAFALIYIYIYIYTVKIMSMNKSQVLSCRKVRRGFWEV